MIQFLFVVLVLVVVVGVLEYAVPLPSPYRAIVRAVAALIVLWYALVLLQSAGVLGPLR